MPLKKLRGIFYMCKLTKFNIVRLSEVEVPQNDSAQFCHSEERGISASNSANKIANLCRVSYGDSSFLRMTKQVETLSLTIGAGLRLRSV